MDAIAYLDKLKTIDIPTMASDVLSRHSEDIADLNASQLAQGYSSDGKPTTLLGKTTYAPLTVALKKQKSGLAAVTSVITGYDTGSMYRKLYAKVNGQQIEYGSSSETAALFEKLTSNRIWGLTDENRQELIDGKLRIELISEIENKLK